MVLVQHQPRHVRPSPARVTALSGAFALHVVVFAVLIAPIARPLILEERAKPKDDPLIVDFRPREVLTPVVERDPVPVVRPRPERVRPVTPVVEVTRPVFEAVPLAEPVVVETTQTVTSADPPDDAYAPVAASLAPIVAPPPRYPIIALRRKLEGLVLLRVQVDTGGNPVVVEVERTSGHRVLDDAARRQVLDTWQFTPAMRDGVAVPAVGLVPFDFTINEG